jgi:hypothetical protein
VTKRTRTARPNVTNPTLRSDDSRHSVRRQLLLRSTTTVAPFRRQPSLHRNQRRHSSTRFDSSKLARTSGYVEALVT